MYLVTFHHSKSHVLPYWWGQFRCAANGRKRAGTWGERKKGRQTDRFVLCSAWIRSKSTVFIAADLWLTLFYQATHMESNSLPLPGHFFFQSSDVVVSERNSKGRYWSSELVCSWLIGLNHYLEDNKGLLVLRRWMFFGCFQLNKHQNPLVLSNGLSDALLATQREKGWIDPSLWRRWWTLEWAITINVNIISFKLNRIYSNGPAFASSNFLFCDQWTGRSFERRLKSKVKGHIARTHKGHIVGGPFLTCKGQHR